MNERSKILFMRAKRHFYFITVVKLKVEWASEASKKTHWPSRELIKT